MRYFLWVGLLLGSFCLRGQSLSLNYNSVHIGRNLSTLFHTKGTKHQFYAGLKFHFNKSVYDNQKNVYYKRGYASSFREHLGLQMGYNYRLRLNERVHLLLFYDLQFSSIGTKRRFFSLSFNYSLPDMPLYTERLVEYEEIKVLEQAIGFGVQVELWEGLFFNAKLGGGVVMLWELPSEFAPNQFRVGGPFNWELCRFISIGLERRLGGKAKAASK